MDDLFHQRRYLIPFRAALLPQIFTDVLVVGAGVAGLEAARSAARFGEVIVAAKGELKDSNTFWAQGGVAAVAPGTEDSPEQHATDTVAAGAGLCDPAAVRAIVDDGPAAIDRLIDLGMPFDAQPGGGFALGREGGHRVARILHADGDATGQAMASTLHAAARASDRIRLFDRCFVLDLITLDGSPSRCVGAITHHHKYGLQVIWAKAVVLAAGGCGQVFRESTNPPAATGDGLAMAFRAGAELADLAFMQFHPTTLYIAGSSRSLITEAVRGEGAILVDHNGHRFMPDFHPDAELAPRDVVSRAILEQIARTNHTHVYLDCTALGDRFARRFPGIARHLGKFGIDPATKRIPVHPAAHYMIGGVRTDMAGRTNLVGLYACGEVACTGLHGANRLASNSLLEGLVMGWRVGETLREALMAETPPGPYRVISDIPLSDRSELDLGDVGSSLRSVLWRHAGILRDGPRLREVGEMFDFWARYMLDKIFDEQPGWELQNLLLLGALFTRAAAWRAESRGVHHRVDHPAPDDPFRVHDLWRRGEPDPATTPELQPQPDAATA